MKSFQITGIQKDNVHGIHVQLPDSQSSYLETYFEWVESSLISPFRTGQISGGILRTWLHIPIFNSIETHIDAEMF